MAKVVPVHKENRFAESSYPNTKFCRVTVLGLNTIYGSELLLVFVNSMYPVLKIVVPAPAEPVNCISFLINKVCSAESVDDLIYVVVSFLDNTKVSPDDNGMFAILFFFYCYDLPTPATGKSAIVLIKVTPVVLINNVTSVNWLEPPAVVIPLI